MNGVTDASITSVIALDVLEAFLLARLERVQPTGARVRRA